MTQFEKSISNKSYTNKDFGTIYPELLDLAKKLSYKWDPTISDESDPGVVLIKLAAILADKLNYNIDKNVLELYPVSVTQLANARKVFHDNGYKMQYYQSAVAPLSFYLNSEPELSDSDAATLVPKDSKITAEAILSSQGYPRTYIIPKYTMFTDTNSSVVYTLTDDVYLSSSRASATGTAIQGKVVQLNVGGSTLITADTLKDTRIVRLPDTLVAENGIFVTSADSGEDWACVDNILVEAPGTRCYEFGISPDGKTCYIEFPEDILQLLGGGLNIHYIVTSGYNGNVSNGYINKFFTDTQVTRYIKEPEYTQLVSVSSDNITVNNKTRTLTGKDPESIESAYRNYKRTRNTFHTLVSTQDYSNFIYTNNDVSNGFVCDRNDDIQSSIRLTKLIGKTETQDIQTRNSITTKEYTGYVVTDGKPTTETATVQVVEESPEMTAFDLRLYGLKYVEAPSFSAEAFNTSFQPLLYTAAEKSNEWQVLEKDIEDLKCISHNFVEFIPNRFFLLKNRFPITAKLISSSTLTITQRDEILRKAQKALYELLNSRVIEFGEEIDYTEVYNTLSNCDARINAIMLNEFRYETYAVYVDDKGNIAELRIDAGSPEPTDSKKQALWKSFRDEIFVRSMLAGTTQPFVRDTTFTYSIDQHPVEFSDTKSTTSTDTSTEEGGDPGEDLPGGGGGTPGGDDGDDPDGGDPEGGGGTPDGGDPEGGDPEGGGGTPGGGDPDDDNPDEGGDESGGNTPGSGDDDDDSTGDDDEGPFEENPDDTTPPPPATVTPSVVELSTSLKLNYKEISADGKTQNWWESNAVPLNSSVVLTAPNLISGSPFTSYVKFVHNIGLRRNQDAADSARPFREDLTESGENAPQIVVRSKEDYVLELGEYIIFFWKDEDSSTAPYKYKKLVGTADTSTIICPTRNLLHMPNPSPSATIENNLASLLSETAPLEGTVSDTKANEYISSYLYGETYDIKTDSISPKTLNRIQLNDSKNHTSNGGRLYWILKSSITDSKDPSKTLCRLFSKGQTKYTLQQDEVVIYTNNSKSELYLLGSGTVIERTATRGADLPEWTCPTITETPVEYLMRGPKFFEEAEHPWFMVNSNDIQVFATEMEYYVLDKEHTIKLRGYKSNIERRFSAFDYRITADGIHLNDDKTATLDLESYDVSYFDAGGNETQLAGKHHASIKWQIYSQLTLNLSPENDFVLDEGETIAGYDPVPDTIGGGGIVAPDDSDDTDDGTSSTPDEDSSENTSGSNTGSTPGSTSGTIIVGGIEVPKKPSWIITGSTKNPVHIQSDTTVNITGNTVTNIEYVDIFTGERRPPSFFIYTTSTTSTTTIMENVSIGKNFRKIICSPGSYILPVKLTDTTKNRPPVVTFTPYRDISTGALTNEELDALETFTGDDISNVQHASFTTVVEEALNRCHITLNNAIPQTHIKNTLRLISSVAEDGIEWEFDPSRKTSKYVCKYFGTDCCKEADDAVYGGKHISATDGVPNMDAVYSIITSDAKPGDISFIISDVGTYVVIQGRENYNLYSVDRTVAKLTSDKLPQVNAAGDQQINSINGFTLRFNDPEKLFEGNNSPVECRTLLQYSTEADVASITSGRYYFCIDIPEGIVYYDLEIGNDNDVLEQLPPVNISSLYKYTMVNLSPTVETKFVITDSVRVLLRQFDKDGYFDYVRTPDSSSEVVYPLDPVAFCDENHIFNKCTICQYTPRAERLGDIQVVNKLR